jgi:GDP-mannose transporter
VCGAVTYVSFDSDFEVRAYGWVLAWYVVFAFDQIYIKYAVDQSSLSVWGRTYYMNALAVVPVSVLGLVTGESAAVSRGGLTREDESYAWGFAGFCALTASCVAGVAMSYSAMQLRGMISATSFTVVGTMCKIATVVINCLIWDKHASFAGLAALFICLFAGLGYEQSPLRNPPPATTKPAPVGSDKV